MKIRSIQGILLAAAALAIVGGSAAFQARSHQDEPMDAEMKMVTPGQIQWQDGPESLPRGAQFAVLEGDPTQPGPFTMRLKAPANYRIPPHTHPKIERVTVLKGTFRLGMGRQFNEQELRDLEAGSFFAMPPGMEHFAATGDEETIVQLNGEGPWAINYINPSDDPRQQR